jgi:hypothetical protein
MSDTQRRDPFKLDVTVETEANRMSQTSQTQTTGFAPIEFQTGTGTSPAE